MKTADLMDKFQDELQSCEIQFNNYGGRTSFYGPCKTLKCHNDNQLVRETLKSDGKGRVLVIDGGGSTYSALVGDLLAEFGHKNKWAGIVVNGVIRDVAAMRQLDLGVKAIGSNPRRSSKEGAGEVDTPVSFGTLNIKPGDWIYCDEDGVVLAERQLPLDQEKQTPR